jgi:hypothetical protein
MPKKSTPQVDEARAKKRVRIDEQADEFARILGCDPEDVMIDSYGVSLSPVQADAVLSTLRTSFTIDQVIEMVATLTHGEPRPPIINLTEARAWVLAHRLSS